MAYVTMSVIAEYLHTCDTNLGLHYSVQNLGFLAHTIAFRCTIFACDTSQCRI